MKEVIMRKCVYAYVSREEKEAYQLLERCKETDRADMIEKIRDIWLELSDSLIDVKEVHDEESLIKIAERTYELENKAMLLRIML